MTGSRIWIAGNMALALAVLGTGCGGGSSEAPTTTTKKTSKAAAKAAAEPVSAEAKAADDLRKKVLKEEDFVESPSNRDPFHSFVSELSQGRVRAPADYYVYFDKYACEELKLIAIVSGDLDPRAEFRDPSGLGIPLKVGDHMCKAHWRIKRIVAEGVVVELEQDTGGVKPKLIERMIPMNPGEEAAK